MAEVNNLLDESPRHFNADKAGNNEAYARFEQLEKDLARLRDEMRIMTEDREMNEKTSTLVASNIALARSNKNLQEFASIASHDLQEPLRKIKTFTSILKEKFSSELPDAASELILKTQDAASRMSVLIKDVLNYSRVAVIENSYVDTDISAIINNIIKDFDLLAEEKNAVVNVQEGIPFIQAIPLQMNQLFL